jgi:glycosyltransferase involved in cell wall biosynthesis
MLLTNTVTSDPRVRKEAASLVYAGYDVTVIGAKDEKSSFTEELEGCHIIRVLTLRHLCKGLMAHRNPKGGMSKGLEAVSFLTRLRGDALNIISVIWLNMALARSAVKQRADVYHAHDLDTLLAGFLAKWWTGKKLVYDFHELFTEQFRHGTKTKLWSLFYSLLERVLVRHADLRVTVCRSLGEWVTQRYGVNGITTIRNVPPLQSWVPNHAGGNPERVILYHGGYYRDRGLEQLIESVKYLATGTLMLRGYGNLEDRLRALVREFGLEGRVVFAPPVPMADLVKTASEADIGVIPYIPFCLNNRFCLPNKLFEYMMAGLAVVGSDLPELRHIILGHQIGGVFSPENPRDIARAINKLLLDTPRLNIMKRNALRAARERYNWEVEGKTLLMAYESVTHS